MSKIIVRRMAYRVYSFLIVMKAELQSAEKSFTTALEEAYPQREAASYVESLRATVREIRGEALRYRADMSYFPSKE